MAQLSYSFSMALLHSLWQAALLWLLYLVLDKIFFQKKSPLLKRNFLFVALTTQVMIFLLGFFIYYFNPQSNIEEGLISTITSRFSPAENTFLVTNWLFNAYLIIILYKIIKAIYTWYHFKQQYKQGLSKPTIDLKLFTQLKAHHFGIKRKVKLWLSSNINTPVTFGFFKPVILLPLALLNNIDMQQAETLILHELTHIKTNDYLLNWFLLVTENIFFFNPFIKLLCKKIRLEREKYCDINVMAFNYPAAVYAETLLKAERIKQLVPLFQLAAVQRKKQLLHRIQFFSSNTNFRQQRRIGLVAPVVSLMLLLLFFSTVLFRANGLVTKASINNLATLYLPGTGGIESGNVVFNNGDLPGIKSSDLDTLVSNVEKQMPLIQKKLKKLQPFIKSIQDKAEEIANEAEIDFAMPATTKENDADREIIIKEESSGTKTSSVKVYRLSFQNGQWIIVPQWMAMAKEKLVDSLSKGSDSTAKRILSQQ